MRRKPGNLVPLEAAICEAASFLEQRGVTEFHGYSIAQELKHVADARRLTGYGTLYRALERLEQMGHLKSRMEDPLVAAAERRPVRRLYELTASGRAVATHEGKVAVPGKAGSRKRWSPA